MNADLTVDIFNAQFIINEALGEHPPFNDLNAQGKVDVGDVQTVLNGVLLGDGGCKIG